MAQDHSFDVVSEFDRQELVNAVDQARREITTRYDFKGITVEINLENETITLLSGTEAQLKSIIDVLQTKTHRRGIDLARGPPHDGPAGLHRQWPLPTGWTSPAQTTDLGEVHLNVGRLYAGCRGVWKPFSHPDRVQKRCAVPSGNAKSKVPGARFASGS